MCHVKREELLNEWKSRTGLSKSTHYAQAKVLTYVDNVLRVTVIILSAIAGTTAFKDYNSGLESSQVEPILILISMALAVFSAIQSGLSLGKKAEIHRGFGALFSSVEKKIEVFLTEQNISRADIESIESLFNSIVSDAPNTATWIHNHVKNKIK